MILLCDIIVAVALYVFFKNENQKLSFYTAAARLIYSAVLGVAIFFLFRILFLLNGTENVAAGVMSNLNAFTITWSLGLILFGIHLILLGILVLKSEQIHRFWGIILFFAGVCYFLVNSARYIFPEFESQIKTAEMILSLPMAFAEIGFAIWLIVRGGKSKTVHQQAS